MEESLSAEELQLQERKKLRESRKMSSGQISNTNASSVSEEQDFTNTVAATNTTFNSSFNSSDRFNQYS